MLYLPQKLELYLLEGLSYDREDLTHYFLVVFADFTLILLSSDQLLVFGELILHFLGLEQVDVLLKQEADLLKDFVHLGHRRRNDSLFDEMRVDA